jgi:hypothetical protein
MIVPTKDSFADNPTFFLLRGFSRNLSLLGLSKEVDEKQHLTERK